MVGFPFLLYGLFFVRLMFSDRVASPGRGLAAQAVRRLGLVGSALVLLAVVYLFVGLVVISLDFSQFFNEIMPWTPAPVFRVILFFLTTLVLLYGIEVLGRVALILLPAVILFILGGILGNSPSFAPGNLLPLMERGVEPLIKASFMQMAYTGELFALGFLAGRFGCGGREVRRVLYMGFLIMVALFFLVSVFLIGVLGESYAVRANFKLFSIFQYGLWNAVTGYDGLFIAVWVTIFFAKAALFQGAIGVALSEITPLKPGLYHLIAGFAAYLGTFFAFGSRVELLKFYAGIYPPISLSFTLLFLVLVYLFPGKDKSRAGKL